jgi:hypothetical protein
VEPWVDAYRRADHQAVQSLTAAMADAIRATSPVYASWMEATTLGKIAEVISRPLGSASTGEVALADREQLAKELAAEGSADPPRQPRSDGPLSATPKTSTSWGSPTRSWPPTTVGDGCGCSWGGRSRAGAPFALVGAVVHAIPYQIVKRLATIPSNEGMKATVKLLGCFGTFSLL